jgi:hypothetical protein
MVETIQEKIIDYYESNKIPLLVFFGSMFVFISIAGTRLFFSDEGIILDQFYNLINGSLALKIAKINVDKGIFMTIGNNLYGKFSYSLLILSLPTYYIFKIMDSLYSAHLFILQLWAAIGGLVIFLLVKIRNMKHAVTAGIISYIILASSNLYFIKPIYFPKWGELLSIEFTNIIISSFLILIIYLFFKNFFSDKIALFASLFILFATPIPFYAISLKHHSLTLLLTFLSFYFFYKSYERKDNKFIYLSYFLAGICVWTRILDGLVLLISLLITDFLVFKRSVKYILSITIVILVSLLPFFIFNYLLLGNPFSIIESTPLTSEPVKIITAKDYIVIDQNPKYAIQVELLKDLGYIWEGNIKGYWFEVLIYSMFLKFINTFGIFLVSPFLIAALGFIVSGVKHRTNWNPADKLLGLYFILLFGAYSILHIFFNISPLISVITDTPASLEYRYLLIIYIILTYFALRIEKVREIIEKKSGTILKIYGLILLIYVVYFITGFPINFIDIYYYMSILIISSFFLLLTTYHPMTKGKKKLNLGLHGNLLLLLIAFAIAQASAFLLFYYWIANMSYIAPSQNIPIIPILNYIIEWMYRIIIF